ncbi:hypothetical protein AB3S75_001708 [Citrus x aurantiifolia]
MNEKFCNSELPGTQVLLVRDSGFRRSTTRLSARSTSLRPGGLLVRLLLQRFLRTQTSQSTPVVFSGANPPTLKSDMKASPESLSSAFFETVWDSNRCVMGKRGVLRVTPRFRGKRGCRGSVRSCVLRHVSGESVAAGVL